MKDIRVLLDTDILLDFLTDRQPFSENAEKIFRLCKEKKINAFIAAHSFINIFYILRKEYSNLERRRLLHLIRQYVNVCSIDKEKIDNSIERKDFLDFEDCVQDECAIAINASYIITRNTKDYTFSYIKALTPSEFLLLIKDSL